MQREILSILLLCTYAFTGYSQSYTRYFTGNTQDLETEPKGGICLMGGASEDDNAMKWFLQRASGGDILILRASGSDGYNDYLYSSLGINVNSVETIVFHSPEASSASYIQEKIDKAEAIWFAGGDQWKYISYWRNTPVDSLINKAIIERNIVIGGTSAGMAILGGYRFSAENGTITSEEALKNPYHIKIAIDSIPFFKLGLLESVVTDTHYDSRNRKGRHVAFLSRILVDNKIQARGIACDEYTAVCVEPDGKARVFGQYPSEDDNAYFIQVNCNPNDNQPESYLPGQAFTWDQDKQAVKVYAVKGTSDGSNFFDLNDWEIGEGGAWKDWYVIEGIFGEKEGNPIDCITTSQDHGYQLKPLKIFPNPTSQKFSFTSPKDLDSLVLYDLNGNIIRSINHMHDGGSIDISTLRSGIYFLRVSALGKLNTVKIIKE